MNVLIVYATRTGSAMRAARLLETALPESLAVEAEAMQDPAPYDAVILGSGIWYGRILKSMQLYLERYWEALREKDKAIYICHALPEEERELLRANFSLRFRNACILAEGVGGDFDPERLSLRERVHLRIVKPQLFGTVREGLLPTLDTKKVKAFAKRFLDAADPPRLVYDSKARRLREVR